MVKCPECGAENPEEAKFCKKCGTNLQETLKAEPSKKKGWSTKKKIGIGIVFFIDILLLFLILD